MTTAILEFRPGEWRQYYHYSYQKELGEGKRQYALMMLETPDFPDANGFSECAPVALVAAEQYNLKEGLKKHWGWVHLGADTKELIGDDIEKWTQKPNMGVWFYLIVSPNDDTLDK